MKVVMRHFLAGFSPPPPSAGDHATDPGSAESPLHGVLSPRMRDARYGGSPRFQSLLKGSWDVEITAIN